MTFRKALFWVHLALGIAAGVVILTMSATGVLLMYEKQILALAERGLQEDSVLADAPAAGLDVILANSIAANGGVVPASITFYSDSRAVAVQSDGAAVYVDAQSGEVVGKGAPRLREFFRSVTTWHRYVGMSGDSRTTGKSLTGAANLLFVVIIPMGLVLWWPRGQSLRSVLWFRRGLNAKARNWNWHNVFGFWMAVPLFLIALSGTVMSYPWANNLVYRATGTEPPQQNERQARGQGGRGQGGAEGQRVEGGGRGRGGRDRSTQPGEINITGLEPLIVQTRTHVPDWKTISLRIPNTATTPVTVTVDRGTGGGQPQYRTTLTMDRDSGAIAKRETFADQNAGRRLRSWLRYVHTGEYYGLAGQTVAGIASFAGVMLAWTGFALTWKRFRSWTKSRSRDNQ